MKTKLITIILLVAMGHFASGQQQKHLNLTVVHDESDRLTLSGQCERDKNVIIGVAKLAEENIKQNFKLYSKAIFALKVPRQGDVTMPEAEKALYLDMSNINPTQRAKESNHFFEHVDEDIEALFSYAYKGANTDSYFGCEMIPLLMSVSNYYLKHDSDYQNVIVLITDGYIDFQDYQNLDVEVSKGRYTSTRFFQRLRQNPELDLGIAPVNLAGSKVIVCEVSPKYDRKFEEMIMLRNTWEKWGEESNAELKILTSDLPVEAVINEIRSFIH